jgi:hypothetical protein
VSVPLLAPPVTGSAVTDADTAGDWLGDFDGDWLGDFDGDLLGDFDGEGDGDQLWCVLEGYGLGWPSVAGAVASDQLGRAAGPATSRTMPTAAMSRTRDARKPDRDMLPPCGGNRMQGAKRRGR